MIALVVVAFVAPALSPALAAPRAPTLQDVNAAELGKGKATQAVNLKAQILLDRAKFSPGTIDGRHGENFVNALRAFQQHNGLNTSGELDAPTWSKLKQDAEPALVEYTISRADTAGPFTEEIPASYQKKAELK